MPGGPYQILTHYAPRRPPPPQARNLIPAALRAAARVAVPGLAWPGSGPWQRGSPGRGRPAPPEMPGHLCRNHRCQKRTPTAGRPRQRRPPNPWRPHRTVLQGRPEWRRPPNPWRRPRTVLRGRPARRRLQDPSPPVRHRAPDRRVPCRTPGYPARNRIRGWPGHRQPWEYCPEKSRSPGPPHRNCPAYGSGHGARGSRAAGAGPMACAGPAAWPRPAC